MMASLGYPSGQAWLPVVADLEGTALDQLILLCHN